MSTEDVVVATVAVNDVQAIVYRKLLQEEGIDVLLVDSEDSVFEVEKAVDKKATDIRVVVQEKHADTALRLIRDFESKRETRVISETGGHIMVRCKDCNQYLSFRVAEMSTSRKCPDCGAAIALPQ